jgi:hypothetical protein
MVKTPRKVSPLSTGIFCIGLGIAVARIMHDLGIDRYLFPVACGFFLVAAVLNVLWAKRDSRVPTQKISD